MIVSSKIHQGRNRKKRGVEGWRENRMEIIEDNRAVSRGKNELIGKFKMAAGDPVGFGGRL